jgi:hypothetical protein
MSQDHWADQFNSAKPKSSSAYMEPGNFLLRIDNIERGKNRKGIGNFKVEGEVVHCFDGTNTVGKSVCDLHSESSDFFFNEVKTLMADIFGTTVDKITFDHLLKAASPEQPLKGMVVEYSAWKKDPEKPFVKKKCKGPITKSEFEAKASEENYERYVDSCRFKKEPEA